MENEPFNLFFTLVKMKFYIVSMLDQPVELNSLYLAEEFLDRRAPDRKNEIIETLMSNGIKSDSDIAFDDAAILKFREIVKQKEQHQDLGAILRNFEIDSKAIEKSRNDEYQKDRDRHAHEIMETLFQLSSNWVMHKEIENKFEDYSVLDEEEVIRPDEAEKLDDLNSNATTSFKVITDLTTTYINRLADYYFKYGGDIQLKEFWDDLEKIEGEIMLKYKDLFHSFGLD